VVLKKALYMHAACVRMTWRSTIFRSMQNELINDYARNDSCARAGYLRFSATDI